MTTCWNVRPLPPGYCIQQIIVRSDDEVKHPLAGAPPIRNQSRGPKSDFSLHYETIELYEIYQLIKTIMIVLKATQDKVLAVLQSVAGIVERRHTLPILANVLIRRTPHFDVMELEMCPAAVEVPARHSAEVFTLFSRPAAKLKQALVPNLPRTSYFSSKVNGRNAP